MSDLAAQTEKLQRIIDASRRVVFFGGAGVSTESGIPDFRSVDGLYSQRFAHPPEEMLSHTFFLHHKEEFFRFYREKILAWDAAPNPAHRALAALEKAGKLTAVITQNIDGLHQAAGSRNVIELHGSIHRNDCLRCGKGFDAAYVKGSAGPPVCDACGGDVKPDVVLYGESLNAQAIEAAVGHIRRVDCLIIGGTSLVVYPAAGLVDYFEGGELVVINKAPTPRDQSASLVIEGAIGAVLGALQTAAAPGI